MNSATSGTPTGRDDRGSAAAAESYERSVTVLLNQVDKEIDGWAIRSSGNGNACRKDVPRVGETVISRSGAIGSVQEIPLSSIVGEAWVGTPETIDADRHVDHRSRWRGWALAISARGICSL